MEALNFPDYYGKNLDALYDCLCEIKCDIELVNAGEVDSDIIETFEDAASENELLT
jgi:RNAse (barnase) inhibitor barstar